MKKIFLLSIIFGLIIIGYLCIVLYKSEKIINPRLLNICVFNDSLRIGLNESSFYIDSYSLNFSSNKDTMNIEIKKSSIYLFGSNKFKNAIVIYKDTLTSYIQVANKVYDINSDVKPCGNPPAYYLKK